MTTTHQTDVTPTDTPPLPVTTTPIEALRHARARQVLLRGTLERNQGRLTFTGRMTLEQFVETTTVHNRAWAKGTESEEAEELIAQREIHSSHAVGLTYFMLQGLAAATVQRLTDNEEPVPPGLREWVTRLAPPLSVAIPPVTLVLSEMPEVTTDRMGTALALSAGTLFLVADGQHRREAARRLRDMFLDIIGSGTVPRSALALGAGLEAGPLREDLLDAVVAIQETFRAWSFIAYEAHLGLSVKEMRQLFINYNYHAQPVSADLSLSFDESHPLNVFNKVLQHQLADTRHPMDISLRQLASITGLAVMGRPNMRRTPRDVEAALESAEQFWRLIRHAKDFSREDSLLRSMPILKGLAKTYWVGWRAPGRYRAPAAARKEFRHLLKTNTFDKAWLLKIPGMRELSRVQPDGSIKFSPGHNEIVAKIVASVIQ